MTLYADREPQDIYLWVSDASFPYIDTKPVHESQRRVTGEKEAEVCSETECPAGGRIIALKCITNRELLQSLFCYMDDVVVLSPPLLRKEVMSHLKTMCSRYII